ncbi:MULTISPECIES: hypothetical protein [Aminobacterium]|jgi:hypothetical protein|uniref:hypothetical protein n=1 Tax=Aminobacterium TaxID=81466 RepID=UPI00257EAE22|nr:MULTISPECIES: hypothetical protein [unclassified Aminobacterium]
MKREHVDLFQNSVNPSGFTLLEQTVNALEANDASLPEEDTRSTILSSIDRYISYVNGSLNRDGNIVISADFLENTRLLINTLRKDIEAISVPHEEDIQLKGREKALFVEAHLNLINAARDWMSAVASESSSETIKIYLLYCRACLRSLRLLEPLWCSSEKEAIA